MRGRPPRRAAGRPAAGTTARYPVELWSAGVPIGRDGAGLVLVYPAVSVSSDGVRTLAHAKLPAFRCGRVER